MSTNGLDMVHAIFHSGRVNGMSGFQLFQALFKIFFNLFFQRRATFLGQVNRGLVQIIGRGWYGWSGFSVCQFACNDIAIHTWCVGDVVGKVWHDVVHFKLIGVFVAGGGDDPVATVESTAQLQRIAQCAEQLIEPGCDLLFGVLVVRLWGWFAVL